MRTIFLIGFMGSGKSSVVHYLAERLDVCHKDTDEEIIKMHGPIASIFENYGEETFRRFETNVLKKMPVEDAVIATGGGIIEKEVNRSWLMEHGIVVHLHTTWGEINRRLVDDESRPLWQLHDKEQLFENRQSKYKNTADISIVTDGKSPEEIATEILRIIKMENMDKLHS
ncbi:shikimate kinase [Sediminibacillus massiliensis]|uniref:shikimate kinase n=1 Tax=Sediminibacillus massiliensis TaxID=1926277 RepID=UPI001FEB833B|nr:shikimate kinase [Sediminibacillus massiliensis]